MLLTESPLAVPAELIVCTLCPYIWVCCLLRDCWFGAILHLKRKEKHRSFSLVEGGDGDFSLLSRLNQ